MARNLTKKQATFVEAFVETGNGTKSALQAYDTEDYMTAAAIASENLKKPQIINALEEALPDNLLAQVHREGLFATKPIYSKEGDLIDEDADFANRAKYLDMAYKLRGKYAAEKHLNLNVDVEPTERIVELTKIANELHRGGDVSRNGGTASSVGTQTPDKE